MSPLQRASASGVPALAPRSDTFIAVRIFFFAARIGGEPGDVRGSSVVFGQPFPAVIGVLAMYFLSAFLVWISAILSAMDFLSAGNVLCWLRKPSGSGPNGW
jgi:hypothetical protein